MVDKVNVSSFWNSSPTCVPGTSVQLHDLLDVIRYRDFQVLQLGENRRVLRHTAPGEDGESLRSALPTHAPPTAQAPSAGLRGGPQLNRRPVLQQLTAGWWPLGGTRPQTASSWGLQSSVEQRRVWRLSCARFPYTLCPLSVYNTRYDVGVSLETDINTVQTLSKPSCLV